MKLIDRIIAYCMWVWMEDRRRRRQEKDDETLKQFRWATKDDQHRFEPFWRHLAQHLRGKARKVLREELDKTGYSPSGLSALIANARICGIVISPEEERSLYTENMKHASPTTKLEFAKHISGKKNVSLPHVLAYLGEQREADGWFVHKTHEEIISTFLAEIDTENPDDVRQFLEEIASHGRYYLLCEACKQLNMDIPEDLLRICFDMRLQGQYDLRSVTNMCIQLHDWNKAEELILRWSQKDDFRPFAAELSLAMYLDRRQEPAVR
jgi:hypothetical protein